MTVLGPKSISLLVFTGSLALLAGCGGNDGASGNQAAEITQPDFILSASSQKVFVPKNHSTTVSISVLTIGTFNSPVQVTITGLPAGVSVSTGTNFTAMPGNIDSVFSAGPTVTAGNASVTITATANGLSHSITLTMEEAEQSYFYVPSVSGTPLIYAFAINPLTGSLTAIPGSPFAAAEIGAAFADPQGQFLFLEDAHNMRVYVYKIDAASGALSLAAGGPYSSGGFPVVDPNGQFLYTQTPVPCDPTQGPCLNGYQILSNGTLAQLPGFPLSTTFSPSANLSAVIAPSGGFAYLTGTGFGVATGLFVYSIDSSGVWHQTGLSSPGGGGSMTFSLAGGFLVSTEYNVAGVNSCGGYQVWKVDSSSGALTEVPQNVPMCIPSAPAFHPNGKYLYIDSAAEFPSVTQPSGLVSTTIDQTTGVLTPINGSPFAVPPGGEIPIEPTGAFIYSGIATTAVPGTIGAYSLDPSTGAVAKDAAATVTLNEGVGWAAIATPQN